MAHDHLIFDLDGTISDPSVGIFRSINYALTSYGYPLVSESSISAFIGPPIDQTFRGLAQTTSRKHILALVAKFRERYADVGYSENSLYPGVPDALDRLIHAGAPLGLCTSKRIDFAERILTMFSLRAIGVLWGHGTESELVDAGADRLLSDPTQLEVLADAVEVVAAADRQKRHFEQRS